MWMVQVTQNQLLGWSRTRFRPTRVACTVQHRFPCTNSHLKQQRSSLGSAVDGENWASVAVDIPARRYWIIPRSSMHVTLGRIPLLRSRQFQRYRFSRYCCQGSNRLLAKLLCDFITDHIMDSMSADITCSVTHFGKSESMNSLRPRYGIFRRLIVLLPGLGLVYYFQSVELQIIL